MNYRDGDIIIDLTTDQPILMVDLTNELTEPTIMAYIDLTTENNETIEIIDLAKDENNEMTIEQIDSTNNHNMENNMAESEYRINFTQLLYNYPSMENLTIEDCEAMEYEQFSFTIPNYKWAECS